MNTSSALRAAYSKWPKLLVGWGVFLQVSSGYWDVFSHRVQFISSDPAWNPAHLSLYTGLLMVLIGILAEKRSRSRSHGLPVFPGNKLVLGGIVLEIIAGAWNELWHLFSLPEPPVAPAHALLVVGMLTVNIGVIVDLSLIYGAARQKEHRYSDLWRTAIQVSLIVAFTSVWLLSSGSLIYVAGVITSAQGYFAVLVVMALISTLVIVPAMLALDWTGFATSIGIGYGLVNYLLIVGYAGRPPYVPLGFIPLLAIDLVHRLLNKADRIRLLILFVGILLGLLLPLTYYPYSLPLFTLTAIDALFALLASVPSSLIGGFLGYKIVGSIGSIVESSFREVSAG